MAAQLRHTALIDPGVPREKAHPIELGAQDHTKVSSRLRPFDAYSQGANLRNGYRVDDRQRPSRDPVAQEPYGREVAREAHELHALTSRHEHGRLCARPWRSTPV